MGGSLANRLAVAAWEQMRDSPYTTWEYAELPSRAKAQVDRTVAAVLRELAQNGALLEEHGGDMPAACLALVEVIERGEQE
jgi:hypothetical protein